MDDQRTPRKDTKKVWTAGFRYSCSDATTHDSYVLMTVTMEKDEDKIELDGDKCSVIYASQEATAKDVFLTSNQLYQYVSNVKY